MRKAIYRSATSSNLEWDPLRVKDIDVITAMGLSDLASPEERQSAALSDFCQLDQLRRLGGLLLCLKGATRSPGKRYFPGQDRFASDRDEAVAILCDLSRHSKVMRIARRDTRRSLAALAITEWLNDACRACGGRQHVKDEAGLVVITCPECAGSGIHRYKNEERASVMGEQWNEQLHILHGYVGLAERVKVQAMVKMLEAW